MVVYAIGERDQRRFWKAPTEAASYDGVKAFVEHLLHIVFGFDRVFFADSWPNLIVTIFSESVKDEIKLFEILVFKCCDLFLQV